MVRDKNKKRGFVRKWRNKYRFMIIRDDIYEVKTSFKLSRLNILFLLSMIFILLSSLVYSLIAYTPMKQYIPGYGNYKDRKEMLDLKIKTDKLEAEIERSDNFIENLSKLIRDDIDTHSITVLEQQFNYDSIDIYSISEEDSLFRKIIEEKEQFTIYEGVDKKGLEALENLIVRPVKGIVSDEFDYNKGHFGIDIVANKNTPIKTILDGRVILSSYTIKEGYVLAVAHENGLISIYKHNTEVLRKVGNLVKAGEVVARLGNTGEKSSGPHLHFELWYNGVPVDPKDYIDF